jgi:hypothetical protein
MHTFFYKKIYFYHTLKKKQESVKEYHNWFIIYLLELGVQFKNSKKDHSFYFYILTLE